MKQPQLGRKILELRKAKGLTQEELVEMCNLNVRTIQRIEAGEVTPRPYTIKAIFEVLGFDDKEEFGLNPQEILEKLQGKAIQPTLKADSELKKMLGLSLVSGGIYFLLVFIEMGMDVSWMKDELLAVSPFWFLMEDGLPPVSPFWYVLIKLLVMIGLTLFVRGFYLLGRKLNNHWLSNASLLYVIVVGLTILADLLMFFRPNLPLEFVLFSESILYGLGLFLFSLSLLTIQKELGPLALVTGALGIVNGILFVTVIMALPGVLLLTWVELLQLALLYRARMLIGGKVQSNKLPAEISDMQGRY